MIPIRNLQRGSTRSLPTCALTGSALSNEAMAFFSSRDRDPIVEDLPDEHDWETMRSFEQLAEIVRTLTGRLARKQRLVFTLRDLQDLTVEEVVEITGLSTGSVKTNLHYARKSIRDMLVRHYGVVRGDL